MILNYSKLENGILFPGIAPVGSYVATQWGLRKVVAHVQFDCKPAREPYGV